MKIQTSRFGEIEAPETEIYTFSEGILGFADVRAFVLLENPKGGPFRWLQSAEIPSLAFVVTDPTRFFPSYKVGIRAEEMKTLQLEDLARGVVLVIITIPKEIRDMTANLQGPIVLNPAKHLGKQIVLADTKYSTRHKLFLETKSVDKKEEKES